jgi:hypothetical protein
MTTPSYSQALAYANSLGLRPTSIPARLASDEGFPLIILQLGGDYEGCELSVWFESDGSIYGEF